TPVGAIRTLAQACGRRAVTNPRTTSSAIARYRMTTSPRPQVQHEARRHQADSSSALENVSNSWPMRPGRQPVILALVSAHFAASLVAVVPERSPIWRVPPLAEVRRFYAMHNLDQRWNMFAPPPRQHIAIMAAFQFTEGWTDLYPLDDFTATRLRGRLILDRGLFRVRSFLRPSNRDLSLTDRSSRA